MNHNKMDAQEFLAINVFKQSIRLLEPTVQPLVSDRYNAKYGAKDLITYGIEMCANSTYAETAIRNLRRYSMCDVPVPRWFRDCIRNVPQEKVLQICHYMLAEAVNKAKRDGLLSGLVMIAFDLHLIAAYEKPANEDDLMKYHDLPGTVFAQGYITVQAVGGDHPITLGIYPIATGEKLNYFVDSMIDNLRDDGINISTVLLDRGFYNAGVIKVLQEKNVFFLMPQPKGETVKDEIIKYDNHKRRRVARFEIDSKQYGKASFYNVIYKKEGAEKKEEISDRYIVFATNIPYHRIYNIIKTLPDEYKKRWGIETGYRQIESVRARTRSKSFSLRIFLFYLSVVFVNMWIILNHAIPDSRKDGKATMHGMVLDDFARVVSQYIVFKSMGRVGTKKLLDKWGIG